MKKKQPNIVEFTREKGNSVVRIKANCQLKQEVFFYQGAAYIVGPQVLKDDWYDIELKQIKGDIGMHIHEFYHGVCFHCGIFKEGANEKKGKEDK